MFFVSSKLNKNIKGHLLTSSFYGFSLNGFYLFAVLFLIILVDLVLCYTNFVQSNHIRHNASTSSTGTFSSGRFIDVDDWKIEIKSMLLPITGYVQEPLANCFYFLCLQPIQYLFDRKTLANLVTLSYTLISIPQIWLLSNVFGDNGRQIACLLFQIRNILDYVDGKVIRNGDQIQAEFHTTDSNKHGRLIDAAGNVISLLCFFTGSFSYMWKSVQKQSQSMIHSSALSFGSNTIHVTRNRIVILNITLFLVYFIIASTGWNMVLIGYTELVSHDKLYSLSSWSFLILYLWRLLSGLSIQDVYCAYVFFNRDYEFISKYSKLLLVLILVLTVLTFIDLTTGYYSYENLETLF